MLFIRKSLAVLILLLGVQSYAQEYDGLKGYGTYKKYDKSYIHPKLRGKHSLSLGMIGAISSPIMDANENDSIPDNGSNFNPTVGVHVGYNYLFVKKRKRIFGGLEKYRDEITSGFGFHLSILSKGEYFIMANYYNPFFSLKGKMLSFYFLNEYGLGIHQPRLNDNGLIEKKKLNIAIEFLRIRLGKSHLNLHFTMNYHWDNDLFGKDRIKMGFMGGLRYYIYKN
jgi:hypothetical protein